jgi:hypothetical protein
MKKITLMISTFALCIGLSHAQESTSASTEGSIKNKKGIEVLPQAGDWSIGIAANPFLQYAGNLMNNNSFNSAPTFGTTQSPNNNIFDNVGGNNIFVKYAQSQNMFFRARLIANRGNYNNSYAVNKDVLIPNAFTPEFVYDKVIYRESNSMIGLGFEKRKGETRLQGFYGAEVLIGSSKESEKYEWANPMNIDFPQPSSHWGNQNTRPLEQNYGRSFAMGARGFIGVEYFFAPKMSIGGEIGYSLGFQTNSKSVTSTSERFNAETLKAETIVTKSQRNSGLSYSGMGLDNASSSINLHFYF